MRLVRFLKKSYHNDTIINAGDEVLLADDVVIEPHMVDVAAEAAAKAKGLPFIQPVVPPLQPVFLDHRADGLMPSGGGVHGAVPSHTVPTAPPAWEVPTTVNPKPDGG